MRTESLKRGVLALGVGSVMLLSGCASLAATKKDPIGGSAAGSNSANANKTLEHCSKPLGTLAVEEDTSQNWFAILTTQYHLPATTPLIRLMIQQSNCFVVVDRGRAMSSMMQERGLADSGELRGRSNMGRGQMVAADYVVTPTIQFAEDTGGGAAALAGVLPYGALIGAVAGSIKHREASTTLMLTDVRSGVQVAVAQGSASKNDFGFGGLGIGGSAGAAMGGYSRTPQGRLIASAFMDSYNEMVRAVRNYAPQKVAGGLGTGGSLGVDGASRPQGESFSLADAQRRLAGLGLYTSKVDGLPGPGTTKAISRFQQIRGLTVTGQLDDATADALRN
ncbi:peptidoglycan-binding protein [Frateuria sp. MAH-13]|uniref:Peptidoglycan-binding protein n=1 Tax=Frateuria flava TaxID=2821489 RepID=A0ABS4DRJ1_9GAMM|nr:peptidoglycan-binding protein [Frateuria flava]MBP1475677.1 peptidoglycan-binding protein [Frateuria flava]